MRNSFGIGVCVCSLTLLFGCGEAATGDNTNGTGGTPGAGGTGGDNRGPGTGDKYCRTNKDGIEGECRLTGWGEGGAVDVIPILVMGHADNGTRVVNTGDVFTEADGDFIEVTVVASKQDATCDVTPDPPGCNNGWRRHVCQSEDDDEPVGTFTLTYLLWDTEAGDYHLLVEAVCPPAEGVEGESVTMTIDVAWQRF